MIIDDSGHGTPWEKAHQKALTNKERLEKLLHRVQKSLENQRQNPKQQQMTHKSMKMSWDKLCKAVHDMDCEAREKEEHEKTQQLQHEITTGDLARDY